jgi:hypothetical protein
LAIVQIEEGLDVLVGRLSTRHDLQPATHLQVDEEIALVQGKIVGQGLGTQLCRDFFRLVYQVDPTKLARIVEPQLPSIVQAKDHMDMLVLRFTGRDHPQPPTHLQVNQQVSLIEPEDHVFSPTPHRNHRPPGDSGSEFLDRRSSQHAGPIYRR